MAGDSIFTNPSPRFVVPHPKLGDRWFLVIHSALDEAFKMIRQRGIKLAGQSENEITNHLEDSLRNDLLNKGAVAGFDKNFFSTVTRGSEVVNYNGLKISKKPDLVFHLQRESGLWDARQDAVFAECKPVAKGQHSLTTNYCAVGTDRVGIERFVIGDYAWAMLEAMMVGYVRDGFTIDVHLTNALASSNRNKKLGSPQPPVPLSSSVSSTLTQVLHKTQHKRNFKWKGKSAFADPIDVFHSWHDCT